MPLSANMDDNSRSSSDSVEVAGQMDNSPIIMNGHMDTDQFSDEDNGLPVLEIVEQPQQRGFRFRYECEGPSHGGLQGSRSERYRKTVPTVKIRNYNGPARVTVELVTDSTVPKAHAHKLVGKNCVDGRCVMEVKSGTAQIAFPSLCIQHVTRKKSSEVLEKRICESLILQKQLQQNDLTLQVQLTDEEKAKAKQEATADAKNMALNVVRLCFQAILHTAGGHQVLPSKISEPIFDSKAPGANALKICRMDKYSGCCTGNDEVFLLCEKVQKDDIMVRFVEQDVEGNILWEAYGHFGPFDVHRQFAIVFKTPEYRDTNINSPVNVLVMLQRKSDLEASDPKSFTYYPRSIDIEGIDRKRKKLIPQYPGGGGRSNSDLNLKFGGGDSNGSTVGGVNGIQNGGSIPDFNNLKATAFGQRISVKPQTRLIQSGDRKILHAARKLPSPSGVYNPVATVMFSNQPADFLSQSTNYVYEEVSKMSPPTQQLDMSPQQFFPTSPLNSSMSAAPTPYSTAPMMAEPPQSLSVSQNMASTLNTGAMSPQQMQAGGYSPQHMQVPSPQSNLGSPINLVNTSQPSIPYGSQMVQMTDNIQSLQMHGDIQMTPVSEMQGQNLSQPVQVSSLNEDGLEADFMGNPEMYGQFQQPQGQYMDSSMFNQQVKELEFLQQAGYQPFSHQSCAFQARGSQARGPRSPLDEDLQDVMAIIGGGYDEVDARVDVKPKSFPEEPMVSPMPMKTGELVSRGGIQVAPKLANPGLTEEPSVGYTAKVQKEFTAKPQVVPMETTVTKETSVQAKGIQTSEHEAQTDMDPMLKLAMKTSQALQYYATSGDIRSLLMVQRFLMAVQDQDGDLPLHTALINMKYEVFQNILDVMVTLPDSYARINAYNFHHQTPLHLAVITNQPAAVDLLIRAGADTSLVDRNGYTPAHLAVLYNRIDCLNNLLKYLKKGVSTANKPFPELNVRCYDGFTPAHLAAQLENLAAMKLLVHGKADVNLSDGKSGRTPLHHCVEADDLSLAAYLILQAGADVNVKRFDGNTALHIACGRGNVGMVALLMAGGADPTIENDDVVEVIDNSESETSKCENESKESVSATSDEKDKDTVEEAEMQESAGQGQSEGQKDQVEGQDNNNEGEDDQKDNEESEVVSEEEADQEMTQKPIRGMVAADFADNNEKILRVLNGEPYSSIQSSDDESPGESLSHVTDKFGSLSVESGLGSMVIKSTCSDLSRVDYPTRVNLSKLLDDSDWSALADKLCLAKFMKGHHDNKSPTRLLLDCYEAEGGTVVRLIQALRDIKREDCVTLVTNAVVHSEVEQAPVTVEHKLPLQKDERADSGMEDSLHKSQSPSPDPVRRQQTT